MSDDVVLRISGVHVRYSRGGRVVRAIRSVVRAGAVKSGRRVLVEVDETPADLPGDRRLGETRTDIRGHLGHGHGLPEGSLAAVGQRNHRHDVSALCRKKGRFRDAKTPLLRLVGASGIEPPTTTMSR